MTSINRRDFAKILAAASAFGAIGPASFAFADDPNRGGTLFFSTLEPAVLYNVDRNGAENISGKIVDGLLDHDLDLNPKPCLATSWEQSADMKEFTFHLRKGVKWHDGQDFTADDVVFSIMTQKAVHPRRRATFADLERIETPDPHTARMIFSAPAPFLLGALNTVSCQIFPKHLLDGKDFATNPAQQAPVGTGPFMFKEWVRGSHVLLVRNPNYWGEGQPFIDQVVLKFTSDPSARVAAFETGELDLGQSNSVPLSELARLQKLDNVKIIERKISRIGPASQFFFNLDTEELKDINVRRAIAHAVDPETVLKNVFYNFGRISPTIIGPNLAQFHDPSIKPYAFDIDLANKMLDDAGKVRDASGKRFSLRITYSPWADQSKLIAEYLRSAFDKVGIEGVVQNYDYATYVTKVYTERAFDIDAQTFANGYDPTDGVQRGYWSKNFKIGLPWSNNSHYNSPIADELFEKAAREPDPEKRKALYFEVQKVVYDDLPSVGLVAPTDFLIHSARVQGPLTESLNLAEIHLDKQA